MTALNPTEKLFNCPKCPDKVRWHAYEIWGGLWVHEGNGTVWCEEEK